MEFVPGGGLAFTGIRTFMKLPHSTAEEDLQAVDFAVVGLPFDLGTTYRSGARFGPAALRSASVRLSHYNMALRVNVFEQLKGLDYGDSQVVLGQTEASYELMTSTLDRVVHAGAVPIVLGGDHSISLPELRSLAKKHGTVAMVHFDAHPDTWDTLYGTELNHGTPFRRAIEEELLDPHHSIHVGLRGSQYAPSNWEQSVELGFEYVTADEYDILGTEALVAKIHERVGRRPTLLSFDIDVLDPAYAPGTGTPEVGGLTSREVLGLLRGLTGIEFVGFDLVEVLPAHDTQDITAIVGAQVVFEFLSLLAINRRDA